MAARSRDGASRCEYSERIGGCSVADLTASGASSGALGWIPEDNRFGWRSYRATEPGADSIGAYAAPGRREDLTGLPPAWIGVGTADLFHDEDVEYVMRLKTAGVPTQLEVVRGAFHGFDVAAHSKVARSFTAARSAAMRQVLTQD